MNRHEIDGAHDDDLRLVGLPWVHQLMGDRSELATRRWLERLRAKGILRPVVLPGKRLRYRRADVEAILRGYARPGQAPLGPPATGSL